MKVKRFRTSLVPIGKVPGKSLSGWGFLLWLIKNALGMDVDWALIVPSREAKEHLDFAHRLAREAVNNGYIVRCCFVWEEPVEVDSTDALDRGGE